MMLDEPLHIQSFDHDVFVVVDGNGLYSSSKGDSEATPHNDETKYIPATAD